MSKYGIINMIGGGIMAKHKKVEKSFDDYIVVNENEEWLRQPINKDFCDNDFMRIVLFYVLHSPCKQGSYSRINLEDFGWKNPWHSTRFKSLLDDTPNFSSDSFLYTETQKGFKALWESANLADNFFDENGKEYAVFSYAGESNSHLDLIHHIRNALAHGRFTARKYNREFYIYMEDVRQIDSIFVVNARIILKKKTLIEWIDIFECRSEKAKKLCEEINKTSTKRG